MNTELCVQDPVTGLWLPAKEYQRKLETSVNRQCDIIVAAVVMGVKSSNERISDDTFNRVIDQFTEFNKWRDMSDGKRPRNEKFEKWWMDLTHCGLKYPPGYISDPYK